jgi:hypothetical protein
MTVPTKTGKPPGPPNSLAGRHAEAVRLKTEGQHDAALAEALRVLDMGLKSGRLSSRNVEMVLEVCLAAKLPRVGEVLAKAAGEGLLSAKALLRLAQCAHRQKNPSAVRGYVEQARRKGLSAPGAKAADRLQSLIEGQ